MPTLRDVLNLIDDVLNLNGKTAALGRDSPLLGAIPGLDSMAVVTLIDRLESRFGIAVDDAEIDGSIFATVGTLTDFIATKQAS